MDTRSVIARLVEEDYGLRWNGISKWAKSITHDSLVVDLDKGLFFWNSEGLAGTAKDYLIKVRHLSSQEARRKLIDLENGGTSLARETGGVPYIPYEELIDILWKNGKNNRKYWYDRTLTDETIDRYRLGYYNEWYLVPLYDDDRFVNFQCRRDEPEKRIKSWYREVKPVLYNADILKFTDTIYIVEGLIDVIVLSQNGVPSVSKNSGAEYFNPVWYSKFVSIKNIYYIADNDKAGINGAKIVTKILGEARVKVFRFKDRKEKYDSGDFFKEGGNGKEYMEIVQEGAVYGYQQGDF